MFCIQNSLWAIFGCWDICKTVLGVFKKILNFIFFTKHPRWTYPAFRYFLLQLHFYSEFLILNISKSFNPTHWSLNEFFIMIYFILILPLRKDSKKKEKKIRNFPLRSRPHLNTALSGKRQKLKSLLLLLIFFGQIL